VRSDKTGAKKRRKKKKKGGGGEETCDLRSLAPLPSLKRSREDGRAKGEKEEKKLTGEKERKKRAIAPFFLSMALTRGREKKGGETRHAPFV